MRPWRIRLAWRRSRVQWALLIVVLLVSTLAATMLASLVMLSSATERFAARAALTEAPAADVQLTHRVVPGDDVELVAERSAVAAAELFGDVPTTVEAQMQGNMLAIPREDAAIALGYLGFADELEREVRLTDGRLPATGAGTEVIVPPELLSVLDLEIGDTLTVAPVVSRSRTSELTIVGVYQVRFPHTDFWIFDRQLGASYSENMVVPFTNGLITTDGFGPLFTTRESMVSMTVDDVYFNYIPDFSEVSLAQVEAVVTRLDDAELAATREIGNEASSVSATTRAATTLGGVLGALAVTRSSVLVTGLLLLVLAVAALSQTSRLMSERRHSELMLMRARGASRGQLLATATFEALSLGAITAAVSPFAASQVYRVIASQPAMAEAGMNRDPGIPMLVWAVTAIVGAVLVTVLVSPLMRRGGSFIDGEQSKSRPGKRAAFQRSGLDVGLVVLAGLAYWQLRSYESPVITDGGIARLDPLLASGPALALLAGALVCVRLIPAASKFLEAIASRGRRAVTPLAAWEVGRRSARAVSAILLLTLAISVGTFAMSFLRTWQTSQDDQAEFQHPAPVVISGLEVSALAQADRVSPTTVDSAVAPVLSQSIEITTTTSSGSRFNDGIDGRPARIIATTDQGLAMLNRGRVGAEGGTTLATALTQPEVSERTGIPLPGTPAGVGFDLTLSTSETALDNIFTTIRMVIEDGNGLYSTFEVGTVEVDGQTRAYEVALADAATLPHLSPPLRIVGLQTVWFQVPTGDDASFATLQQEDDLELTLSIDALAALDREPDVPVPGVGPQYSATPIEVAEGTSWYAASAGVVPQGLLPVEDQMHISMTTQAEFLRRRPVTLNQTAWPIEQELEIAATSALLTRLNADVGDVGRIEIDGAVLDVRIVDEVSLAPGGNPRGATFFANLTSLQKFMMQSGAPAPSLTSWWADVPADQVDAYVAAMPQTAEVSTQAAVAQSLREDPLRVGTQAALWLVAAAAVVLAAVGFAVHAVVTVRSREIEFAQLRAVGLSRDGLTRLVGTESALLATLSSIFGVGLGLALAYMVAPLVSVGPDGRPPVPEVVVDIPWTTVGLLAAEVALVLIVVIVLVSFMLRRINPAALLRLGD